MGATGSNKSGKSNSVMALQDGNATITLDSPLVYSDTKQAMSSSAGKQIMSFENKHVDSKREHSILIMDDGTVIENNTGGKSSVKASTQARMKADILSHNHPNPIEGALGGTFSSADLNNFVNFNQHMYRASSKEGTYVITVDTDDPSYTRTRALNLVADYQKLEKQQNRNFKKLHIQWKQETSQALSDIYSDQTLSSSEMSKRSKAANKSFMDKQIKEANRQLVEAHNWLVQNANKYGFHYGLERRT